MCGAREIFAELNERGGVILYGRSDAVLNPGGVRIGTSEIYRQVEQIDEVLESLVIGQDWQGDMCASFSSFGSATVKGSRRSCSSESGPGSVGTRPPGTSPRESSRWPISRGPAAGRSWSSRCGISSTDAQVANREALANPGIPRPVLVSPRTRKLERSRRFPGHPASVGRSDWDTIQPRRDCPSDGQTQGGERCDFIPYLPWPSRWRAVSAVSRTNPGRTRRELRISRWPKRSRFRKTTSSKPWLPCVEPGSRREPHPPSDCRSISSSTRHGSSRRRCRCSERSARRSRPRSSNRSTSPSRATRTAAVRPNTTMDSRLGGPTRSGIF